MELKEQNFGPIRIIAGDKGGRYPSCHSIFVEEAGVLIDPAANRDRLKALRSREKVRMVWLSHWHEDHFRDLDLFDDKPLWMEASDAPPLADMNIFFDWYGVSSASGDQLRAYWEPILKKDFHFRPRMPQRFLEDGEVIDLGRVTAEVIHIPGHSPGQLAFFFREPGVLFMADCDLTPFGPWYGDRYSSVEDTIRSIHRLRAIPAKVWLTAHETGVFERPPGGLWDAYLGVIEKRESALLNFLSAPRTMDEIVEQWIVYGRERKPREFYEYGERAHMEKHLDRLIRKGEVVLDAGRYHKTTGASFSLSALRWGDR